MTISTMSMRQKCSIPFSAALRGAKYFSAHLDHPQYNYDVQSTRDYLGMHFYGSRVSRQVGSRESRQVEWVDWVGRSVCLIDKEKYVSKSIRLRTIIVATSRFPPKAEVGA